MKKIKYAAALLALVLMTFSFISCNVIVQNSEKAEKNKPYVICTAFPQYDFLRNIVGDAFELELLLPPGYDTHSYALKDISAAHLTKLPEADLIVSIGGESDEALVTELSKFMKNNKAEVSFLRLVDLVSSLLDEDETMGMHIEAGAGGEKEDHNHEGEEDFDEHVWTSPKRAVELVHGLCEAAVSLDKNNEETFRAASEAYIEKLEKLDKSYEEILKNKTFDTLIFADRFPFRYLCYDYGISADAAFRGCSTSIEPTAATLEYLYNKAHDMGLPTVLYMEGSNPIYAEQLAKSTGGKALLLHSCHIISEKEFASENYLSLMEKNLETLKIALGVTETT